MHIWQRYPSSSGTKLTKMRSGILPVCCVAIWRLRKNRNIGAQPQSITSIKAPKTFWKIYFVYDFWCAQSCSFRAVFGPHIRIWHCSLRYIVTCGKKYICVCTYTFSVLNYCGEIFFKSLINPYEVLCTNLSAEFWTFRNFSPQFRENCGAT